MRKQTVFISFFTSCTQPCPSDLSAHTSGVWRVCACVCVWRVCVCVCDVCVRALAHAAFTRGVGVNAWRRACLKRGADAPKLQKKIQRCLLIYQNRLPLRCPVLLNMFRSSQWKVTLQKSLCKQWVTYTRERSLPALAQTKPELNYNSQLRLYISQFWEKSQNCVIKSRNNLFYFLFSGRNRLPYIFPSHSVFKTLKIYILNVQRT